MGVRARSLYERQGLEDPGVKPFFSSWITAGEEARIYDGELPQKLAIFDSQIVLMPLIGPGEQMQALLIRHPQLAQSVRLAFEYIWERSEPVAAAAKANTTKPAKGDVAKKSTKEQASPRLGSNNHRRRFPVTGKAETA